MIVDIWDLDLSSQTFKDFLIIIFISPRAAVKKYKCKSIEFFYSQGLPTSISSTLGGLGPNPLHPALSMLKPQLPDPKREDELRKSLSESNGETPVLS